MDNAWAQILVALLALGSPLLAYLIAVRKASGRIRATDASDLWTEAGNIRRECAERVRVLEARVAELEGRNMELAIENARLTRIGFGDGHA
jgi:hypothetical protein